MHFFDMATGHIVPYKLVVGLCHIVSIYFQDWQYKIFQALYHDPSTPRDPTGDSTSIIDSSRRISKGHAMKPHREKHFVTSVDPQRTPWE